MHIWLLFFVGASLPEVGHANDVGALSVDTAGRFEITHYYTPPYRGTLVRGSWVSTAVIGGQVVYIVPEDIDAVFVDSFETETDATPPPPDCVPRPTVPCI